MGPALAKRKIRLRSLKDPMKNTGRSFLSTIVILLAISFVGAMAYYYGVERRVFRVNVTFANAKGIIPGSPVVYEGVRIGEVQKIQFDTANRIRMILKIDTDKSTVVRQKAIWVVDSPDATGSKDSILLGYCRNETLDELPGVVSKTEFRGEDSTIRFGLKTRIGCFGSGPAKTAEPPNPVAGSVDDLRKEPNTPLTTETVQQLIAELEKLMQDLARQSREKIETFLNEKGPEVREKANLLLETLEENGFKDYADRLREFFEEYLGPLESDPLVIT